MCERILARFRTLLERLLLVWLVLLCTLVFFWNEWSGRFQTGGIFDPFAASEPILGYLIALTMFAIGSLLPEDEVRLVAQRWPMVLYGTALQYTAMPMLGYFCARAFGLEGPLLIGAIIVGCVPGAMASNVLTMIARGNVSYSVGLTTSATLLSPIMVPLVLWLTLGQFVQLPIGKTFISLCWMVVLPVGAGYGLARLSTRWEMVASRLGAIVANLVILWIIATVVALNRDKLSYLDLRLILALVTINVGGYLAGYVGGRAIGMPFPMRRAVILEVGMQNAGLGTALAIQLFDAQAAIPCAMYTFGCMFTGTILARCWAEYDRRRGAE